MVNVAVKRHDNSVYLSLTQNVPDTTGPRPGKGTQCLGSYALTCKRHYVSVRLTGSGSHQLVKLHSKPVRPGPRPQYCPERFWDISVY